MTPRVAIVIPTLNEERTIRSTLESALSSGADEIVVSDGGSTDRTREIAIAAGVTYLEGSRPRGRQLNRAVQTSNAEIIVFLHGDTTLPPSAAALVREAIEGGARFGGFRIRFAEEDVRLRVAETMINLRTRITRCPWGDQAQFVLLDAFCKAGGFREIPLMEDYDLALRMKATGPTVVLPQKVTTSGRRFLRKGVLATAATNWQIILAYRLGANPVELEKIYRE